MQSLHICLRPVGMVDRRLGARGAKSAQNKDKQKNFSRHLHNCGLSFLAIRRRRHFYQSQSSGQAIFSDRANFFQHRSKNLIHNPFRHVCLFGLVLLRFLLTLFLEKKMSELTGDWRTRPRAALLTPPPRQAAWNLRAILQRTMLNTAGNRRACYANLLCFQAPIS